MDCAHSADCTPFLCFRLTAGAVVVWDRPVVAAVCLRYNAQERHELITANKAEWDELILRRESHASVNLEVRLKRINSDQDKLEQLRVQVRCHRSSVVRRRVRAEYPARSTADTLEQLCALTTVQVLRATFRQAQSIGRNRSVAYATNPRTARHGTANELFARLLRIHGVLTHNAQGTRVCTYDAPTYWEVSKGSNLSTRARLTGPDVAEGNVWDRRRFRRRTWRTTTC